MSDKSNRCAYVEKGIRLKVFDNDTGLNAIAVPCCHLTSTNRIQSERINSYEDIINHKTLIYFKDYFGNNDDLPKECAACINMERKGLNSPRIEVNKKDFEGYDINRLDVVLGNTCNLACPFCNSNASSLIAKLATSLNEDERPITWKPATNFSKGSNTTPEMVAGILKNKKVHTLKLIGGEPFLKENWDRISEVIGSDACKDMHLDITTNGTVLNDDIFEKISKTKSAFLRISVDSIGRNYEFIRWPHSWDKMHRNLDYVRNNKLHNIQIGVSNLVNIFNFEFLPEIEQYFSDMKISTGYTTEIKPASHIQNYENLPEHIIEYVRSKIKRDSLKYALVKKDHGHSKEKIKKEFEILLAQRKMKAEDVIGPMTREWLGL
jgi:MoaA/NifB/PqqE/SkfB family radical SAM enzyme